jgi:hypothetical protein
VVYTVEWRERNEAGNGNGVHSGGKRHKRLRGADGGEARVERLCSPRKAVWVAESDTEVVLVGDVEPCLGAQLHDTGTWRKRVRCGEDRRVEVQLAEVEGGACCCTIRTGMEMGEGRGAD